MSIQPLLAAPPAVFWHAVAALAAFLLGLAQLLGPKGTGLHRALGWAWAALMMTVAASSFLIGDMRWVGPFGPIHLLSILVLVNVPLALLHARRGRIGAHAKAMKSLFVFALVVAGAFTLLPGRLMGEVAFGWPTHRADRPAAVDGPAP